MASLFYRSLKYANTISLKFYFSNWQVNGRQNIPPGPVMFVPNHQNAFLDAVILACSSEKNPWFLTRANVFNKPLAAWILNKLQMLPIYRFRDGFATLKKNEKVFDDIVSKLNQGESILIFAEGNHNDQYQLRPLQKGVARIALAADSKKNIAIVPVGIQYDSRTAFRSRVLVNFGKPLFVNNMNLVSFNMQDKIEVILAELRTQLQPLMLHIDAPDYNEKLEYLLKHRQHRDDLKEQLLIDQAVVSDFPGRGNYILKPTSRSTVKKMIIWYMKINNIIAAFIIRNLILTKLGDEQFKGSVKFASGMFLAPLCWIIQAFIIFSLTGSSMVALGYFLSLPLSVKLS